jgi:hypothetical protein
MEKKSYIIVDEFNRWQSTGYDATEQEIQNEIEFVRNKLKEDGEDDTELLLFYIEGKPINV